MARHAVLLAAFLMQPDCPSGTGRHEILDLLKSHQGPEVEIGVP